MIKTKEIEWKKIVESKLEFELNPHGGNVKWSFETEVQILTIEPTYFSKKDNRLLAEILVNKAPEAVLSNNIVAIANGKFPWYLF